MVAVEKVSGNNQSKHIILIVQSAQVRNFHFLAIHITSANRRITIIR